MSVTIEFFGVPGAGKTHLAHQLAETLRANGTTVADFTGWSRCWKLRALIRYRTLLLRSSLVLATSSRPLVEKPRVMRFLLTTLERYYRAQSDASDTVYLFDEGVIQRLFMLLVDETGSRISGIDRLLSQLPVPDRMVHVTADPDLVDARIESRERGLPDRFKTMTQADWRAVSTAADVAMCDSAKRLLEIGRSKTPPLLLLNTKSERPGEVLAALRLLNTESLNNAATTIIDLG